jgi:hypothetical protein
MDMTITDVATTTNTISLNSIDDYITISDNSSQFLIYDTPLNAEILTVSVVENSMGYDISSYLTEAVYLKPINYILNTPSFSMVDMQFKKYVSINKFVNNGRETIGYDLTKFFTPINRFNNK